MRFDRKKVLPIIAKFLHDNFPSAAEQESARLGITTQEYKKLQLDKKVDLIAAKARLNLVWVDKLSHRLSLNREEIIRATNTVLEIIEETLKENNRVKLKTLGDFYIQNKRLSFKPSSLWNKELGKSSSGLKNPKGRLIRTS